MQKCCANALFVANTHIEAYNMLFSKERSYLKICTIICRCQLLPSKAIIQSFSDSQARDRTDVTTADFVHIQMEHWLSK
ncbi:hypothetical protein XENTR_v10013423 [Xenopus tropicalis]|nr:hypothetical protein XENTR_v10013423 [Xenopus tropicalis]